MVKHDYDVRKYQKGCQKVRNLNEYIHLLDISEDVRKAFLSHAQKAIEGTVQACEEIYNPDLNNINHPGSDSDWETDKKGLKELGNIFE